MKKYGPIFLCLVKHGPILVDWHVGSRTVILFVHKCMLQVTVFYPKLIRNQPYTLYVFPLCFVSFYVFDDFFFISS